MSSASRRRAAIVIGALALVAVAVAGVFIAFVLLSDARREDGETSATTTAAPSGSGQPDGEAAGAGTFLDVREFGCPTNELDCVALTVPLDHANPQSGETLEVHFAVQRATGDRIGAFVTAVGGPGESGIEVAPDLVAALAPIADRYDLIVFDQRGSESRAASSARRRQRHSPARGGRHASRMPVSSWPVKPSASPRAAWARWG